jgi:SAM-dependent methyltransferase
MHNEHMGETPVEKNINANPWSEDNDAIQQLALEECAKRQRIDRSVSVLVLPGGQCKLAVRFAQLDAQVTVADISERQREIEGRILASGMAGSIHFAPTEFPAPPETDSGAPYDIIVLRHGLCSLPYAQGKLLIRQLMRKLKIGGKLYLSILGLHSELGEGYPGREQSIYERYSQLSPAMARKYDIRGEVCLYSERDLFLLLLESGASVLRTMTTTWGNVKAVAVRV